MSKQTLKKLAFSILTTALMVAFVGAFTQKTSKKDNPPSVKLKDIVEKLSPSSIGLKDAKKFELIVEADGQFGVIEKSTRQFFARISCGACPATASSSGGKCRADLLGVNRGGCRGCGKKQNDSCTINF